MSVLTELKIRQLLKEKKISFGESLIIEPHCVITPSAKSFANEKRITLTRDKLVREPKSVFHKEIKYNATQENMHNNESIEYLEFIKYINHLYNLLYFPLIRDDDFNEDQWASIKELQQWLIAFKNRKIEPVPVVNSRINGLRLMDGKNRVHLFSCEEIVSLIEYLQQFVIYYDIPNKKEFFSWSKRVYNFLI